jgi:hypothetical protein
MDPFFPPRWAGVNKRWPLVKRSRFSRSETMYKVSELGTRGGPIVDSASLSRFLGEARLWSTGVYCFSFLKLLSFDAMGARLIE